MYIHLTTHSAFSLQEGLLLPAELVQAAKTHGMTALGLTDHRLLSGSIEFAIACKQAGVQPVLGLEIDLEGGRLSLFASSLEGWANLCRLSSFLALRPDPRAVCPLEQLVPFTKDLIALSEIPDQADRQPIGPLMDMFPERLYIALCQPATPGRAALQRTLTAIHLNCSIDATPAHELAPAGSYFASENEIRIRYKPFPAALEAAAEIAARCKFDLPLGIARMPTVPLPPGLTAAQALRRKAEAGVLQLYGALSPEIQARL